MQRALNNSSGHNPPPSNAAAALYRSVVDELRQTTIASKHQTDEYDTVDDDDGSSLQPSAPPPYQEIASSIPSNVTYMLRNDARELRFRARDAGAHSAALLLAVQQFRVDGWHCDVSLFGSRRDTTKQQQVIAVDSMASAARHQSKNPKPIEELSAIRAHKLILAAASPFIKQQLLQQQEHGTSSGHEKFTFSKIQHDCLQFIVNFIYTGEMNITETVDNDDEQSSSMHSSVCGILVGALQLELLDLARACESFLSSDAHLTSTTCIASWLLAVEHDNFCNQLLRPAAEQCIGLTLPTVMTSRDFLQLSAEQIELLLPALTNVADADVKYDAVVAWLSVCKDRKKLEARRLFKLLDFGSMSRQKLVEVCQSQLYKDTTSRERSKSRSRLPPLSPSASSTAHDSSSSSSNAALRISSSPTTRRGGPVVYVLGGVEAGSQQLLTYDTTNSVAANAERRMSSQVAQWESSGTLPWRSRHAGACVLDDKLYVVGGSRDKDKMTNSIDVYDLLGKVWLNPPLNNNNKLLQPHACVPVVAVDDMVYVVDGSELHAVTEKYCPKTGVVRQCSRMHISRQLHGAVAIAGGRLVVAGDVKGNKTIEVYDCVRDRWMVADKLKHAVHSAGVTALGDDVYVCAGTTVNRGIGSKTAGASKRVEVFNTSTGHCREVTALNSARTGCGAVSLMESHLICIVGGRNDKHAPLNSVEVMDVRTGKWMMSAPAGLLPDLPTPMDSPAVVIWK